MNGTIDIETPPRPPAPPARRRGVRLARRAGLAALGLTLAAGSAATTARVISHEATSSRTEHGVRVVEIDSESGDLHLAVAPDDALTVTATQRWAYSRPTLRFARDGDRLLIRSGCPTVERAASFGVCAVQQTVLVPRGAVVRVSSSSGSISANDLDVKDLQVEASSGNVTAGFTVVPERVRVESSAGDLRISLPYQAYRIDAGTSAGSVRVGVISDPRAARLVYAHTSAGDVHIDGR
jgi:hypothetical protein